MKQKRKRYSEEYKRRIVALHESNDRSAASLEREYEIGKGNILRWQKQYGGEAEGKGEPDQIGIKTESARMRDLERKNRLLERENRILQQERDILKKAIAIFSQAKPTDTGLSKDIE